MKARSAAGARSGEALTMERARVVRQRCSPVRVSSAVTALPLGTRIVLCRWSRAGVDQESSSGAETGAAHHTAPVSALIARSFHCVPILATANTRVRSAMGPDWGANEIGAPDA